LPDGGAMAVALGFVAAMIGMLRTLMSFIHLLEGRIKILLNR